jgi:hypothetical protein
MASSSGETWKSDILPWRAAAAAARSSLEGLLHVPLGAHLQAADRVLFLSFRRDDDDRNGLVGLLLLHALEELEAVHDRHVDVEEDEVDALLLAELVQRLQPVHGADELAVLVAGEEELVHLVDERRVVDGEDLPQHRLLSCRRPAPDSDLSRVARADETG